MGRERFRLSASVFVMVLREQQVLLLRRAGTGWHDGDYSLPAGGHDGNETLLGAAARELREETGLKVEADALRLVHTLHCRLGDSDREWLGFFFTCSAVSGLARIEEPAKHDDLGWFPIEALPANTIPYTQQAIVCAQTGIAFSTYGWPHHADEARFSRK